MISGGYAFQTKSPDRNNVNCSEKKLMGLTKPTDIDDVLFDLLADKEEKVSVNKFWNVGL